MPTEDYLLELIDRLTPDDPITHSTEGLDDACMWCYGWGSYTVVHEGWCPWMETRGLLGKPYEHTRGYTEIEHVIRHEPNSFNPRLVSGSRIVKTHPWLKPGEAVCIHLPGEDVEYYVGESSVQKALREAE